MKTYLLTAAGVIFFSVIVSLIIPEGKLNKTIVFVMRMACILVLLQPITGIFKISSVTTDAPLYDYEFIEKVYSDNQGEQLEKLLSEQFGEECNCSVRIEYDEGKFELKGVDVEVYCDNQKIIEDIYAYLDDAGYINITVYAKSS